MPVFDVIVVGLGAMGSSAAYSCSKSGVRVLGLEQFQRGHTRGSSHGQTRLIRKAYFEHPNYVPLLERSYELWAELEREMGKRLFHPTSLIIFGGVQSSILDGVRLSSLQYQIPTIEYSPSDCVEHFPQFCIPKGFAGIEEKTGGFLEVEKSVDSFLRAAEGRGAELHFDEAVLDWKKEGEVLTVQTASAKYRTKKLILTAGPWASRWLKLNLKVHRAPQFWFQAPQSYDEAALLPCFAFDMPNGFFYGFPTYNEWGFKIALHKPGLEVPDPSVVDRTVAKAEGVEVQQFLKQVLPQVNPTIKASALCLYTMTPDSHFVLDYMEDCRNVVFAAGFSGHGFKFAPAMGEALSEMVGLGVRESKSLKSIGFLHVRPSLR